MATTPRPRCVASALRSNRSRLLPVRDGIIRQAIGDSPRSTTSLRAGARGDARSVASPAAARPRPDGRSSASTRRRGRIIFDVADVTDIKGRELRRLRRRMQMISRTPRQPRPRMTAGGIIAEPLDIHKVGQPAERRERARSCWPRSGSTPAYASPTRTSSRAASASASGRPGRPATRSDRRRRTDQRLDVSIRPQIINLPNVAGRVRADYLFIAHDLSVVRHISDRTAVMYLGRMVELAGSRDLALYPLPPVLGRAPVGHPDPGPGRRRASPAIHPQGDVPSPVNPPSGCRFHTAAGCARSSGIRALPTEDRSPGARHASRGRLSLRGDGRRVGGADPVHGPAVTERHAGAGRPASHGGGHVDPAEHAAAALNQAGQACPAARETAQPPGGTAGGFRKPTNQSREVWNVPVRPLWSGCSASTGREAQHHVVASRLDPSWR